MTQETARILLSFMVRVQLTGQEVPAWEQAVAALREIIEPKLEE